MGSALILMSFPPRYVVVGIAGIFVGSVEDERMGSQFQVDGLYGVVGELGLQPQARQRVAFSDAGVVLVVTEECHGFHLGLECADIGRVNGFGRSLRTAHDKGESEKRRCATKTRRCATKTYMHIFSHSLILSFSPNSSLHLYI